MSADAGEEDGAELLAATAQRREGNLHGTGSLESGATPPVKIAATPGDKQVDDDDEVEDSFIVLEFPCFDNFANTNMLRRFVDRSGVGPTVFDPSLLRVDGIDTDEPTVLLNGALKFRGTWRRGALGERVVALGPSVQQQQQQQQPMEGEPQRPSPAAAAAAKGRRRVPITSLQGQAESFAEELQPSEAVAPRPELEVRRCLTPTAVLTLRRVA